MLKVAFEDDEAQGGLVLSWWGGDGAARVLAWESPALLMERAEGSRSLATMARDGRDDAATRILGATAARLHAHAAPPPGGLIPLPTWFEALAPVASAQGGILAKSVAAARRLLAEPRDVVVLHGDLHHDNVLDFGQRGWLAIDPKRLIGERGFDYANIFTNPDLAGGPPVGTRVEVFARRLELVVAISGIERARLLDWILAWTGLSAAWFIADGASPAIDLAVAELAAARRDQVGQRQRGG